MMIKNVISLADFDITMMLTKVSSDGSEVGYDFENNCWLDNNLFTKDRLIKIGKFAVRDEYKKIRKYRLITFSHIFTKTVKAFEGIETKRGTVVLFKIADPENSPAKKENKHNYRKEGKKINIKGNDNMHSYCS